MSTASPARIAANRENAKKSTGPKTEDGKRRARANALKHGLTGQGVVLPADRAEEFRTFQVGWFDEFRPVDPIEHYLVGQLTLAAFRLDHIYEQETALIRQNQRRDLDLWDVNGRDDAETLGTTLADDPQRVVNALTRTSQGCDWLLSRWDALGAALGMDASELSSLVDEDGADDGDLDPAPGWGEEHLTLALDLSGIPNELRSLDPRARRIERDWNQMRDADADPDAAEGARERLRSMVARRIERLEETAERRFERIEMPALEALSQGIRFDISPEMQRLWRYVESNRRAYDRALKLLEQHRAAKAEGKPGLTWGDGIPKMYSASHGGPVRVPASESRPTTPTTPSPQPPPKSQPRQEPPPSNGRDRAGERSSMLESTLAKSPAKARPDLSAFEGPSVFVPISAGVPQRR